MSFVRASEESRSLPFILLQQVLDHFETLLLDHFQTHLLSLLGPLNSEQSSLYSKHGWHPTSHNRRLLPKAVDYKHQ